MHPEMGALRHIVVSDLHLGALNSVLTNVGRSGVDVDTGTAAPVLTSLGACLRSLSAGADPPELVVLGDLFELALTPLDDAAATFGHFVRAIGLGERDGAVGPHVRFVAGNHDHQLWTRARLDREVAVVAHTPKDHPLPGAAHVTSLFPDDDEVPARGRFVEELIRRAGIDADVTVTHSYPNLAIRGDGDRVVVMHHGHFIERLYRIVSSLDEVFDRPRANRTVVDLESDNAGWIDFFWSSEGDSGDAGVDVRMVYESLVSGRTLDAELDQISRLVGASQRPPLGPVVRWVVDRALRSASGALGRAERHHPGAALSPDAVAGLAMYLAGPVALELRRTFGTQLPDTTFVFGHTHKPFVATRGVAGYARPIAVVNTGGWVVDHPEAEPLKGATVVLVDDEANVVSLQLYRQRSDGAADPPFVVPADGRSIAFAEQVRSGVDVTRDPWRQFSADVGATLAARRDELQRRELAVRRRLRRAELGATRPGAGSRARSGSQ